MSIPEIRSRFRLNIQSQKQKGTCIEHRSRRSPARRREQLAWPQHDGALHSARRSAVENHSTPASQAIFLLCTNKIPEGGGRVSRSTVSIHRRQTVTHLWHEVLPDVAYDCLENLARAVRSLVPGLHREPFSDAVLVAAVAIDPIPVVANAQVRGRRYAAPVELRVPDPCPSAAREKQENADEDETRRATHVLRSDVNRE